MQPKRILSTMFFLLAGCAVGGGSEPVGEPNEGVAADDTADPFGGGAADYAGGEPDADLPLEVRFLGVGGFMMRRGQDVILTGPFYTNPNIASTGVGRVSTNRPLVDRLTQGLPLDHVSAILVGHAHYDHLMDVPYVWTKTPNAQIIGNRTMKHILAAYAPDRAAYCEGRRRPDIQIPRDRVVQMNDPVGFLGRDYVDYRMCPHLSRDGVGGEGQWVQVEGANIRVRALCSEHPDQLGPFHFGEGSIGGDLCEPPASAANWLEGETLAYLIDFLDPATGAPIYRVFYQDAPTNGPAGHVAPELLAEKRVDVALLCVGNYTAVRNQPMGLLDAMQPRYALGGHWEDFFHTQEEPIRPLPFHDIADYRSRLERSLPWADDAPMSIYGVELQTRQFIPMPGAVMQFTREQAPVTITESEPPLE